MFRLSGLYASGSGLILQQLVVEQGKGFVFGSMIAFIKLRLNYFM